MKIVSAMIMASCCLSVAFGATSWEQYLELPTPQNASRVTAIEYSPSRTPKGGWNPGDLQLLQNQVLAEDPEAFRLAVRLYRNTDTGGLAEDLGILLGRAIRPHPTFFLREVAALKMPCSQLSWPLNAPGDEYADRPMAQTYEIAMRRKALGGVTSKDLRYVRDDCLKAFREPPR
jgi:hypothetical protein